MNIEPISFDQVIVSGAKAYQVLTRPDGSEVKIVAQQVIDLGRPAGVDVYALHREAPDQPWRVLSNLPHPDWRVMSVDEYTRRGRSELLQHVSHGELLKVAAAARAQQLPS